MQSLTRDARECVHWQLHHYSLLHSVSRSSTSELLSRRHKRHFRVGASSAASRGGAFLRSASLTLQSQFGPPVIRRKMFCPFCFRLISTALILLPNWNLRANPPQSQILLLPADGLTAFFNLRRSGFTLSSCMVKKGGCCAFSTAGLMQLGCVFSDQLLRSLLFWLLAVTIACWRFTAPEGVTPLGYNFGVHDLCGCDL